MNRPVPERIYNPITAMGFSAMFTFQLDNTNTLLAPYCHNGSCRYIRPWGQIILNFEANQIKLNQSKFSWDRLCSQGPKLGWARLGCIKTWVQPQI